MTNSYEIAVYYFPNYHLDARNEKWHGKGWTEWDLVKRGTPRFPGHQQPKVPLWGYLDESKPEVAEKQIAVAADHGITSFIYDWYWYDDGPFLNAALEQGFLQAANNDRLKFSLMWANCDWFNIFPLKRSSEPTLLVPGTVSRQGFDAAVDYIIKHYFSHPSYWRVDGALYFSFYELMSLVKGLGGIEETLEALDYFREKTREAGLGEIHLNAVVWGVQILPNERRLKDPDEMLQKLGFDSVTSYVWIHNINLDDFQSLTVSYPEYAEKAYKGWDKLTSDFSVPYYPNVTVGWDASPRTVQSDVYENLGYPFTPILVENTPAEFKKSLVEAKRFLDEKHTKNSILTVNSWNEWTEGSYLEPDVQNGLGFLEAIRDVFGKL